MAISSRAIRFSLNRKSTQTCFVKVTHTNRSIGTNFENPQWRRRQQKEEEQQKEYFARQAEYLPESDFFSSKNTWAYILAGIAGIAGLSLFSTTVSAAEAPVDYEKVRKDIEKLLDSNPRYDDGSFGPLFVRLAWHAAGTYDKNSKTGGSNGATMRFGPEANAGANKGLQVARNLLEPIKAKYPGLSYADLWTLAGAVAIEHMQGPKIPWKPGRTDATSEKSCPPDGRLPDADKGADHIRSIFYRMGFNDREIVALVGAHTLGRCHTDRSGFTGPWTRSPTMFSNSFFQELLNNTWTKKKWNGPEQFEDPSGELMMLPSDLAFIKDPKFKSVVELYASDEEVFFKDFSAAFSKLLELGVPRK